MTDANQTLELYRSRFIEYSLSSAATYVTQAACDAARAHGDLHWLTSAKQDLAHAKAKIAEFEQFIAVVESGDDGALAKTCAEHDAVVRAACALADAAPKEDSL